MLFNYMNKKDKKDELYYQNVIKSMTTIWISFER